MLEITPVFHVKVTNFNYEHQLLPLVQTPVTGHKKACLRDREGPGNR